jgi:hypothetical protein
MGFMLLIALALTKGGAYHAKRVMVLTLLQNEMSFFLLEELSIVLYSLHF